MTSVGLIARADDRGIGIQTWEFARHMDPDRVLVVDEPGARSMGFVPHFDRYPGATVVEYDPRTGRLPEATVREWLDGLDVVFFVETPYDWRVCDWARDAGTRSVCQLNPEFFRHLDDPNMPSADVWWAPTSWRLAALPPDVRRVPVPVALDRWPEVEDGSTEGPLRVLHVAGHQAAGDRNGTRVLAKALKHSATLTHVTVTCQDERLPVSWPRRGNVTIDVRKGSTVANHWDLYAGHDVLVLPRRYGGLCLPAIEAQGAGLAVVMSDTSPQDKDWPAVIRARSVHRGRLKCQAGMLTLCEASERHLAAEMDALARDRGRLAEARRASRAWAEANSWEALRPLYEAELERAVEARV